jgi:hypothetical protein
MWWIAADTSDVEPGGVRAGRELGENGATTQASDLQPIFCVDQVGAEWRPMSAPGTRDG